MHSQSLILKAVVALLVLWLGVWGVLKIAGGARPTPEKVMAYMEADPLAGVENPEKRREILAELASMLNQLEPEEVATFQEDADDYRERFFEKLSKEEQFYFMERRIGRAFDQMMQAFNKMERSERKKIVERTLRDMRNDDESGTVDRLESQDAEMVDKMVNEGLRAYYQEANAEAKIDLAPVLEEMQRQLGGHRGPR